MRNDGVWVIVLMVGLCVAVLSGFSIGVSQTKDKIHKDLISRKLATYVCHEDVCEIKYTFMDDYVKK